MEQRDSPAAGRGGRGPTGWPPLSVGEYETTPGGPAPRAGGRSPPWGSEDPCGRAYGRAAVLPPYATRTTV